MLLKACSWDDQTQCRKSSLSNRFKSWRVIRWQNTVRLCIISQGFYYSWKLETIILSVVAMIATLTVNSRNTAFTLQNNLLLIYCFLSLHQRSGPIQLKEGVAFIPALLLSVWTLSDICTPTSLLLLNGSKSLQLDPKILWEAFPEEWGLLQYSCILMLVFTNHMWVKCSAVHILWSM